MSPEDTKLKIRVASEQHSVDWGTGIAAREIRGHSFRLGDEHGYQRAIDELKEINEEVDHPPTNFYFTRAIEFLEGRQKELNILRGKLP